MKPIQPIMSDVVARLVRPAPLSIEKVLFAWRLAVGSALARATVVRLRPDGSLFVQLQDERWRPELELAIPVVRDRMASALGAGVLTTVRLADPPASSAPARRRTAGRTRTAAATARESGASRDRSAPATSKRRPR